MIRAVYAGPGEPIEIYRVRRYERPVDVYMPPSDAPIIVEAKSLGGRAAIFSYPRPGSFLEGKGFTRVSFLEGPTETTVMGARLDLETAVRVAESVGAEGRYSLTSTGVPAPSYAREGRSAPAMNPVPPVSAAEHRIQEGIATDSALVYDWWHGGEYGQTALDLLNNGGVTPGADVYYSSYAWSGPAGFVASVLTYPGICTGVRIALIDAGYNTVGLVDYVHIESTVSEGETWSVFSSGWTSQHLGTVLADESEACKNSVPPGWTGAHLHHAINSGYDHTQEDTDLQGYLIQQQHADVIEPAYDYINQWVFRAFTIDADGDGVPDGSDNCPYAYNPGQENTDSAGIPNGADIPDSFRANPHKDPQGDACDEDDDADWLGDANEATWATNPVIPDTDGDRVLDGAEVLLGSNPLDPGSKPPPPAGDGDADGLPAWLEAFFGSSDANQDSDGDGFKDGREVKGYGTSPVNTDTDGDSSGNDGCKDDKQIVDVDGNGQANTLDVTNIARIALTSGPFDPVSEAVADIDKNGGNNILDVQVAALNSTLVEPHSPC